MDDIFKVLAKTIKKGQSSAKNQAVGSVTPRFAVVNDAGMLVVDGWKEPYDDYVVLEHCAPVRPRQTLVVIPVNGVYVVVGRFTKMNQDDFDDEPETEV